MEFTCDGADASPPIEWASVPDGTVELVLTLQDPDTPSGVFTHWTVFGIDPGTEGFPSGGVTSGVLEGTNEFGDAGYGGPCPPDESHRYFFTLAALSSPSGLAAGASSSEVDVVVQAATATTTLTGVYPG